MAKPGAPAVPRRRAQSPSIIIGSALGLVSYYIYPKYSRITFILLLGVTAIIPVLEIYFNPQIYFYNPLVGFYPGTIYDERLSFTFRLLIYRLINVMFFLLVIYFTERIIKHTLKINKMLFLVLISSMIIVFLICSSFLGFSTTRGRIETSLKGKCYTEHFEIIYDTYIDTDRKSV